MESLLSKYKAVELLNLIIDPTKFKTTCFLCLERSDNTTSVYQNLEIHDKHFNLITSLSTIMRYLFPTQDIILEQCCEDCANLIIELYLRFQRNTLNKTYFNYIIDNLSKKVNKKVTQSARGDVKKCKIRINLSKFHNVNKQSDKTIKKIREGKNIPELNLLQSLQEQTHKDPMSGSVSSSFVESPSEQNMITSEKHQFTISRQKPNKSVICDICGKVCKTSTTLKAHLNCHTQKQCPYCSKMLKTHSHYKIHLKNHDRNAVKRQRNKTYYSCNDCSYKCLNKNTLEAHINKTHLHIRPYICQTCFKGFYKKSNLTEHIAVHDKVKNETCDICGESFVCKKTLYHHLRLHTDERPYECEICSEKFITSGRRNDHVKRKHMEKSVCCLLCDKKYSLRKDLNRHMKKVHTDSVFDTDVLIQNDCIFTDYGYVDSNVEPMFHVVT